MSAEARPLPLDHFVAKWHRREPEMAVADPFLGPAADPVPRAWGALLNELRETAFELSDPRVAEAKGQWWAEELLGLAAGRARHPLAQRLLGRTAPWAGLARGLAAVIGRDERPRDTGAALAGVAPLADAIAETEAALHGVGPGEHAGRAIAVHLLLQRLPEGLLAADQAGLPMQLLARHGRTAAEVAAGEGEALLRDWAGELRAALPAAAGPVRLRRLRTAFDRARLARLAAGRGFDPPPAPATLWRAWRAARGA